MKKGFSTVIIVVAVVIIVVGAFTLVQANKAKESSKIASAKVSLTSAAQTARKCLTKGGNVSPAEAGAKICSQDTGSKVDAWPTLPSSWSYDKATSNFSSLATFSLVVKTESKTIKCNLFCNE